MADTILKAITTGGNLRALACVTTVASREVCGLQKASPTTSVALGRALAGAALLCGLLKQDQRIALKFEGNGPVGKLLVEADCDGALRGCAGNPGADLPPRNGVFDVPGLIGHAGFLTVSKDLGCGEPYRGVIQLRTSEIGDDLAWYLTESEQIPSAVGLGVALDENCRIAASGGFLVQALPDASEEEIETMMQSISTLPPLSQFLTTAASPEDLLALLFRRTSCTILQMQELFFRCGCSRQKALGALAALGRHELLEILENEGDAEITCEFCKQLHSFGKTDLERIADEA